MGRHLNLLAEQAAQQHTQILKKRNKKSIDIKKIPPLRGEQLRKIVRYSHSKKDLAQSKRQKFQRVLANKMHQFISSESLTCPICFEIIVGSALTQCGHMFCLHCIENVQCSSKQCPLCRTLMESEKFILSKKFDSIISKYVNTNSSKEEISNYQKRLNQFLLIQSRRQIRCKLYVGDALDFQINSNWIAVYITKIEGDYVHLCQLDKATRLKLSHPIHKLSRRLARCRTFTKLPPLKPTYYSERMNFPNQNLSFIVEPPRYSIRSTNLQETVAVNQFTPSRWEQFQNIGLRNEQMFADIPFETNIDIWNVQDERDDFILFS